MKPETKGLTRQYAFNDVRSYTKYVQAAVDDLIEAVLHEKFKGSYTVREKALICEALNNIIEATALYSLRLRELYPTSFKVIEGTPCERLAPVDEDDIRFDPLTVTASMLFAPWGDE